MYNPIYFGNVLYYFGDELPSIVRVPALDLETRLRFHLSQRKAPIAPRTSDFCFRDVTQRSLVALSSSSKK